LNQSNGTIISAHRGDLVNEIPSFFKNRKLIDFGKSINQLNLMGGKDGAVEVWGYSIKYRFEKHWIAGLKIRTSP
jgi:hypothetical protein